MASVNFYLKRSKEKSGEPRKDLIRVYLKFSINRSHRFDLPTGEKILFKYWNNEKQCARAQMPGHIEFNQALARINDQLIQLYRDNKSVDLKSLKAMCDSMIKYGSSSPPVEKKSVLCVLDLFLSQYRKEKDSKTVKKYEALAEKLNVFNPKLTLQDLDVNFYDAFKDFLFACPNPNYRGYTLHFNAGEDCWELRPGDSGERVGLFDDTVYKYFVNLKTVLGWAGTRGFEVHPSYKTWEIITRRYPPITLTLAELEKLEQLEITPDIIKDTITFKKHARKDQSEILAPQLNLARDYLVIESRTGQRISDIKRFDPSGVADFKWTLTPKKGNRISSKKVTVHFKGYCAPALWIFQRHNYKLPTISEQKLNENIKKLAKIAGIDQEVVTFRWAQNKRIKITGPKYEFISTHTGRKTFVTIALQFMPHKIVKDLAGIDSYETLKHYEGQSEDQMIEKYLNQIQDTTLMIKVQ
jgi:hypothetical protein